MSPSLSVAACESAWASAGTMQHLVWKAWWYPNPSSSSRPAMRHDGPAIIYQGWVPHIAKLQNGDAVMEDNKK